MKALVNSGLDRTSLAGGGSCPVKSHFPHLIRPAFGLAVLLLILSYEGRGASFSDATPLSTTRGSQTATLLSNDKLLVAGGQTNGGFTSSSAELYDPAAGTWAM